MKTISILFLIWAAIFSCNAFAEKLTVYSITSKVYDVSPYAVGMFPVKDGQDAEVEVHSISKKVGVIDTGDTAFASTVKLALAEDHKGPFFGPGFRYLVKDSAGQYFIVFFEYKAGDKTFTGRRIALGRATDLGSNGALFIGTPYEGGVSFNKNLLAEFKKLAEQDMPLNR